jgi:hypothetical protein
MIASGKDHTVSLHGSSPVASGLEMFRFQAAPIVDEPSSTTVWLAADAEGMWRAHLPSSNTLGSFLHGLPKTLAVATCGAEWSRLD